MSEGPQVLVIGAGIAGLAAALAAKREGASVEILEGAAGSTALASGAWDLASAMGERAPFASAPRTIDRALDDVARARPAHPWARLPRALSREALESAHDAVLEALAILRPLGAHADAELVVTDVGLVRRVALAQRAVLDLAPLPGARIAVAWMRAVRGLDGPFVAASLNEQAVRAGDARRFVAIEVELFRRAGDAILLPHELAGLLDADDARRRAVSSIARAIGGAAIDAVIVPPMLGLEDDRVRALMEGAIERPIGELVEALSGAQSLRLGRRIGAALDAASIVRRQARATKVVARDRDVEVVLEDEVVLRPRAIVLATGKHLGGGIAAEHGDVRETLAGLPIWSGGRPLALASSARGRDPIALYGDDPFAPGPGFALGVGWDDAMCALDAHRRPFSRSLFACGALLDGVSDGDGTGLGVAATTGWIAGRNAARRALG